MSVAGWLATHDIFMQILVFVFAAFWSGLIWVAIKRELIRFINLVFRTSNLDRISFA